MVKRKSSSAASSRSSALPILSTAFFALLAVAALLGKLPLVVLALYVAASVITFIAYAFDKSAATNNTQRTPERTLHLFALIGGWPGAVAAQKLLHHKSKKPAFQTVFMATVILNCATLGWLFTPAGSDALNFIFAVL